MKRILSIQIGMMVLFALCGRVRSEPSLVDYTAYYAAFPPFITAAPKPNVNDWLGEWILQNYAPVYLKYGFHFKKLDDFNFTPVIRPAVRNAKPTKKGHYTVYLPAFSDKRIQKLLSLFPTTQWEVFSKHGKEQYQAGNIMFRPVSLESFELSLFGQQN